MTIEGKEHKVYAGDSITVPAGEAHTWSNSSSDETVVNVKFIPALRMEYFFESYHRLRTLEDWRMAAYRMNLKI